MKKRPMPGKMPIAVWTAVAGISAFAHAGNLISDFEVESNPLSSEFTVFGPDKWGEAEISPFEEEYTWNKCLRFEVKKLGVNEAGRECIDRAVLIGADESGPGFPVTGGEKFDFSIDIRGTVPSAVIEYRWWNADGAAANGQTTVKRFHVQKKWTSYRGSFQVPEKAVKAALSVKCWWDEKYGKVPERPGSYLLVDKIEILAKNRKQAVWPWRACVIPEKGWVDLGVFTRCDNNGAARVSTKAKISCDDGKLMLAVDCPATSFVEACPEDGFSRRFWFDDLVELFIGADDASPGRHLAVTSHGGRWIDNGDYETWSAKVEKSGDGWRVVVSLPWGTAGFKSRPAPGVPVRFNIMRQRYLGSAQDKSAPRGTRNMFGYWTEDSNWSFSKLEYNRKDFWGYLFCGTMEPYIAKTAAAFTEKETKSAAAKLGAMPPTDALRRLVALKDDDRLARLSKRKFIVAQVPVCCDTAVPFLPDEINDPQKIFRVRAAVNEIASLPVAVANMTAAMDEYRVMLDCGWERREPQHEHWKRMPGLKADDGSRFESVRMLRGVRSREADTEPHGARLDMLVPMNAVSSVPVGSKESGLVWVEFDCRGARPGVYRGEMTVVPLAGGSFKSFRHNYAAGGYFIKDDSLCIPVELEILPIELPQPSTMSLNGYTVAFDDYQLEFLKDYDVSHVCVSPWHFEAGFNADGSIIRKPRRFLRPLLEMVRRNARNFGEVPGTAVCYDAYDVYRKQYGKHLERGSAAYWRGWREWLRYIYEMMHDAGFADGDYVTEILDEPGPKKYPDREEVLRAVREARAAVPKMRLFITSGARYYYEELKDSVDEWVFYAGGGAEEYARAHEFSGKPGKLSTMYDCQVSIRMSPYSYFRMLPWLAAYAGGKYVSIFQTLEQITPRSFRQTPFGEMTWDTGNEVVGSIRLQCLRAGMTDVRYLRLLESLAGDGGGPAEEVRAFCRKSLKEIPLVYRHDRLKADAFRDEAIKRILELKR